MRMKIVTKLKVILTQKSFQDYFVWSKLLSKMTKATCKNPSLDDLTRQENITKINDYNNNILFGKNVEKTKILSENELSELFEANLKIEMENQKPKIFESMDIAGAASYLLKCKSIVIMTGAGISTSVCFLFIFRTNNSI